eukprot:UN00574
MLSIHLASQKFSITLDHCILGWIQENVVQFPDFVLTSQCLGSSFHAKWVSKVYQ